MSIFLLLLCYRASSLGIYMIKYFLVCEFVSDCFLESNGE
jgi:hypothetical protein